MIKMMWETEILDRIKNYDFILLDTNFFSLLDHKRDIAWELNEYNIISDLGLIEEDLLQLNDGLEWKLEEVVKDSRVFTIQEVKDEISRFKEIFIKSERRHNRFINSAKKKRPFGGNSHFQKNYYIRKKIGYFIEKALKEIRENGIDPYNGVRIDPILNDITINLEKIIKNLRIYEGPIEPVEKRLEFASDIDHLLVEAAFGCFLKDQSKRIAVVSDDAHIQGISYKNSVYPCFDIITLSETISQNQKIEKNLAFYAVA